MSLSNIHNLESDQSQRYAAAESLLQHSRLPRTDSQNINGFVMPDAQNAFQSYQPPMQSHLPPIPVTAYPEFKQPFHNEIQDQMHTFTSSIDAKISSSQEKLESPGQQVLDSFSEHGQIPVLPSNKENSRKLYSLGRRRRGANRTSKSDESDPISPTSSRGFTARNSNGEAMDGLETNQDDDAACLDDKDDMDNPPAWSELKTKAGKERKRLPLACIACRRKKIRCSGEKPACKHCLRSRIPCVYKVTARKAAPRTDYMAMLDKRLKRMEERVIKTIPKEELATTIGPGRANVRPPATGDGKAHGGKKRAVGDAFEPDLDDWAESKAGSLPQTGLDSNESKVMTEGSKNLPAREIQEHLAEVFFSCLYGQSYHLLHKPSFMKRLR